jgi:putative endonuclease
MPGSENLTKILFHYVYVLESTKYNELYIGHTTDLRKRVKSHNLGLNFSTKPYKPWRLIHFEAYLNDLELRNPVMYDKNK